jgi:hypothetical protein
MSDYVDLTLDSDDDGPAPQLKPDPDRPTHGLILSDSFKSCVDNSLRNLAALSRRNLYDHNPSSSRSLAARQRRSFEPPKRPKSRDTPQWSPSHIGRSARNNEWSVPASKRQRLSVGCSNAIQESSLHVKPSRLGAGQDSATQFSLRAQNALRADHEQAMQKRRRVEEVEHTNQAHVLQRQVFPHINAILQTHRDKLDAAVRKRIGVQVCFPNKFEAHRTRTSLMMSEDSLQALEYRSPPELASE